MVDQPDHRKDYYRHLVTFMSYRDNVKYGNDVQFTPLQLGAIKPEELVRYFCTKVYGIPEPEPDDNPTLGRCTSIEMAKKAISYYMPNKLSKWNPLTKTGNPTKSDKVNELIKRVKNKEVGKEGAPSQAKRPLEPGELEQTFELLNSYGDTTGDITKKYMIPAVCKFQYSMVARLDDIADFKEEDLKPNPQFPFTLLCEMCWSKNASEESDAPGQILLGAIDRRYCVLLALGIFLEVSCEAGHALDNEYLFGESGIPKSTARAIYNALKSIWGKAEFKHLTLGSLNTHSTHKLSATRARRSGCSKDDVDSRGRWGKPRDASVNLPYPDAKVAAALCVGGPCMYQLRQGSGVTNAWLRRYVVPNILLSDNIQDSVAMVLALPVLWAAFDDEMEAYMPDSLRNRIRFAYADIEQLEAGVNPVKKVLLMVTGHERQVRIDPLFADGDDEEQVGVLPPRNNRNQANEIRALYAQNLALRREVEELRTEGKANTARIMERLNMTNTNVSRIARQPPVQREKTTVRRKKARQPVPRPCGANDPAGVGAGADANFAATISPTPRTLYELWQEYEFGICGRKAAKDFTAQERGRVKHKYTRRKVVWDKIAEMIRGGWTAQAAIDRLDVVYGPNVCVTRIINQMKADRARGGHPELRV